MVSLAVAASPALKPSPAFALSQDFPDSDESLMSEYFSVTYGFSRSSAAEQTRLFTPSSAIVLTAAVSSSGVLKSSPAFAPSQTLDDSEDFLASEYFLATYGFGSSEPP
jgi:hypothetical protein